MHIVSLLGLRTILHFIETKIGLHGPPLTQSLLRHAVQLTTGRLKLDILMGGGHIGSPLARVHFERPATMLMYCISCPTYLCFAAYWFPGIFT